MARKSDSGMGLLIALMVFIVCAPVVIIVWIVKAINNKLNLKNPPQTNNLTVSTSQNGFMNVFSYTKAIHDAKVKANEINEDKRIEYSIKCKKRLKLIYFISFAISIFFGLIFLFAFIVSKTEIDYLILSSILFIIGIIIISILSYKLQKPVLDLAIQQIEVELKKTYSAMTKEVYNESYREVLKTSKLYKKIDELNKMYSFDYSSCKKHFYKFDAKSKQGVENYNFDKSLNSIITEEKEFFNQIANIYDKNSKLYSQYDKKYQLIKEYTDRNTVNKYNIKTDYEIYNFIEREIYNSRKLKGIVIPSVEIKVEYTSPTGRAYYENHYEYFFNELSEKINLNNEQEKYNLLQQTKKEKLAEEKREKEKKLKELDKIEKQLQQKEQSILQKESEFEKATQGHIYSTQATIGNTEILKNDCEETKYQQLKKLKQQYENGEISREEYMQKRNDLL